MLRLKLLLVIFTFITLNVNAGTTAEIEPIHLLKTHTIGAQAAIFNKVATTPDFTLEYLRKLDEKPNYSSYTPGTKEMEIIRKATEILPPQHKKLINDRLIGIYFVNDFLSSGYTEWVIDSDSNLYFFIVFNPKTLESDISRILTEKEKTAFIKDDSFTDISIDCGKKHSGFYYIFLHEAGHILDYLKNITPYVEKTLIEIQGIKIIEKPFTEKIWADYSRPEKKYDFPERNNIKFYGFGGGPKIKISDSAKLYKHFSKTPFFTLYASQNWVEDWAEFYAFTIMANKLKIPYTIKISQNNKIIYSYKPYKNSLLSQRMKKIKTYSF